MRSGNSWDFISRTAETGSMSYRTDDATSSFFEWSTFTPVVCIAPYSYGSAGSAAPSDSIEPTWGIPEDVADAAAGTAADECVWAVSVEALLLS